MALAQQTLGLLRAAKQVATSLPADAVLLLPETGLDWPAARAELEGCRVLVAAQQPLLLQRLRDMGGWGVVELDPDPAPTRERLTAALLRATAGGHLKPGADVVMLFNGITADEGRPEPIDTLSLLHLGEHLERLDIRGLRKLQTQIPAETLQSVVKLATEIGREGREGKPVGTLLVVGDTRRVLARSRPMNFNPFRGYGRDERDLRHRKVREQIKDIAQMDGAILIGRDGVAVAACVYLDVIAQDINLPKGLGSRHMTAAAVSKQTHAIAVVVSQSSGTVRLFQNGEVMLHIEPLLRPHVWQPFQLGAQDKHEE